MGTMKIPRPSNTGAFCTGIWAAFVLIATKYFVEPHFEPDTAFSTTRAIYYLLITGPAIIFVVGLDETLATLRFRADPTGDRSKIFRRMVISAGTGLVVMMSLLVLADQI